MIYSIRCLTEPSERALSEALSRAEPWRRDELRRYKSQRAVWQSLSGDEIARELLHKVLPEHELHFRRDENGKPFLLGGGMHFNVSHSDEFVLCAVDDRPIGADIEKLREVKGALLEKVCSAQEIEWIAGDSARFLQVWTAKEAYLKYLGVGLRRPLREVNVIKHGAFCLEGLQIFTELTDRYAMSIVYEKRHL